MSRTSPGFFVFVEVLQLHAAITVSADSTGSSVDLNTTFLPTYMHSKCEGFHFLRPKKEKTGGSENSRHSKRGEAI